MLGSNNLTGCSQYRSFEYRQIGSLIFDLSRLFCSFVRLFGISNFKVFIFLRYLCPAKKRLTAIYITMKTKLRIIGFLALHPSCLQEEIIRGLTKIRFIRCFLSDLQNFRRVILNTYSKRSIYLLPKGNRMCFKRWIKPVFGSYYSIYLHLLYEEDEALWNS